MIGGGAGGVCWDRNWCVAIPIATADTVPIAPNRYDRLVSIDARGIVA